MNSKIMNELFRTIFTKLREHMVSPTESITSTLSFPKSNLIGILPPEWWRSFRYKRFEAMKMPRAIRSMRDCEREKRMLTKRELPYDQLMEDVHRMNSRNISRISQLEHNDRRIVTKDNELLFFTTFNKVFSFFQILFLSESFWTVH